METRLEVVSSTENQSPADDGAAQVKAGKKDPDGATAAEAREVVKQRVRSSAGKIADGLVEAAAAGQVAVAKFLFEVAGVYPVTEGSEAGENSLAYILLKRLGLPTEMASETDTDVE